MSRCSNLLEKFEGLEKFEAYSSKERVQPKTREELKQIIEDTIKEKGNKCDLNFIDTSKITNMSRLFVQSSFDGNISKWDVSNVKDMYRMFAHSKFNGDISKWNVSKVEDMSTMFSGSPFNKDISKWDVSNVKDMSWMFANSPFNGDISKWNVSNVKDMGYMFYKSKFNGDISKWRVSKNADTEDMFKNSPLEKKYGPHYGRTIKEKPEESYRSYRPYGYWGDWTEADEYALYDPYGQWGDKLPSQKEMENAILDAIEAKMTDYARDGVDPDECTLDNFYRYSRETEYPSEQQFINIIYKPYEDKYGSVQDLFKNYKKTTRYKKFKTNLLAGPAGLKLRSKGLRFSSYH